MSYTLAVIAVIVSAVVISWGLRTAQGLHADRRKQVRGRRRFLILALGSVGAVVLPRFRRDAALEQSLVTEPPDPPESPGPNPQFAPAAMPLSRSMAEPEVATQSEMIITECRKWLGTPYSWGGGNLDGPSRGFGRGAKTVGFDCSAYVRLVIMRAAGVKLPRTAHQQMNSPKLEPVAKPRVGDLVYLCNSSGIAYHCGIYAGRDVMYAATKTGDVVRKQAIFTRRVRYRTLAV